jgi:hypothetical protein
VEGNTTTSRIAWSLAEISVLTGLSLGYLRNEQRSGRLAIKKFGRRVVVLDEDLRTYLTRGSEKGVSDKLRQDGHHETI